MRYAFLALCLTLSTSAFATDFFYGKLKAVSAPTIKVISQEGVTKEYQITAVLDSASIDKTSINLSQGGMMAMCGDYLGKLAEDFSVTVSTNKGEEKTALVKASRDDSQVNVYGMCQQDSNILTQLQIASEKPDAIEVK